MRTPQIGDTVTLRGTIISIDSNAEPSLLIQPWSRSGSASSSYWVSTLDVVNVEPAPPANKLADKLEGRF